MTSPQYVPTNWLDHIQDDASGEVYQQGTPVDAQHLNNIESGVVTAQNHQNDAATHIITLTHSKSGTVHKLTGAPVATAPYTAKFAATAAYVTGDLWQVGGDVYTAKQQNGEPLFTDFFISGAKGVQAEIDPVSRTLDFKSGGAASLRWYSQTAEPVSPKEGDVWIVGTDVVDRVILTPNFPDIKDVNTLYLNTGASALQSVPIVTFAVSARSRITAKPIDYWLTDASGARLFTPVKIWTGTAWREIVTRIYYDNGDERAAVTGGWIVTTGEVIKNPTHIALYSHKINSYPKQPAAARTVRTIDFSSVTRMYARVRAYSSEGEFTLSVYDAELNKLLASYTEIRLVAATQTILIDVSGINTAASISVRYVLKDGYSSGTTMADVYRVWGE